MTLLSVDPDLCTRDGRCVAECPAGIIEFKKDGAVPSLVAGGQGFCISCGHCVAVCPHGALSHARMATGACPPMAADWRLSPRLVGGFLRGRRSIRSYRKAPVARETLAELIDIARYAPSGHNLQPVCWQVFYQRETLVGLIGHVLDWMKHLIAEQSPLAASMHLDRVVAAWEEGTDRILRGAPHLVGAHALKEDRTAPAACTIALTYLELGAAAHGLGACWAGYFNAAANFWPPMARALALPEGHTLFGALMIGVPRVDYHRVPLRKEARVTWG